MYQPGLWHDYFTMVGGGAAALTGLVFVAMSLHLEEVTRDPVHRHRARSILTGLIAIFLRCGLVLMGGQNGRAVAIELIGVLLVVEVILYRSLRDAMGSPDPWVLARGIGSFACLLLEQGGALILFSGNASGLYVIAVGMLSSFIFIVTGAWLLLVGVGRRQPA